MASETPPSLAASKPLNLSLQMPESSTSRSRSRARRRDTADSLKSGARWARTVDDPWWPCMLTLDGGGIRGYSSLLILKELMHRIHVWETRLHGQEDHLIDQDEAQRGRPSSRTTDPLPSQASSGAAVHDAVVSDTSQDQPVVVHVDASHNEHTSANVDQQAKSLSSATESKVPPENGLLPCHYFDFMFGTSTGGLIATMLGRLRMTVPECLELYRQVGDKLFGHRRSNIPLMTKYHHEPLEKAVQKIVSDHCRAHDHCDGVECLHPWPEELARQVEEAYSESGQGLPFDVDKPRVCQSCCLTATHDEKPSVAYLLRTYSHYYTEEALERIVPYNEGADPLHVWEVTRATSAAPFYFRMLETQINGQNRVFKDGGIRENNPSGAALNEFNSLYYNKTDVPALLLSVGTGRPDSAQDGFASVWPGPFGSMRVVRNLMENLAVLRNVLIRYTEGETLHERIRSLVAKGENTWYKRLNVDNGLQDMPLDDWKKGDWHGQQHVPGGKSLARMEAATEKFLRRDFKEGIDSYAEPSVMIDQVAEKLVRQRRAREQLGGERWDVFVGKQLFPATTQPGSDG